MTAELGEGPVWVESEKARYFVDILGRHIHRWQEDGSWGTWRAPAEPGFIVPRRGGGFICGLRGGFYFFESTTGTFALLVPIEKEYPRHRINDGFVDTSPLPGPVSRLRIARDSRRRASSSVPASRRPGSSRRKLLRHYA